jgi:hypothetical protein
VGLAVVVGYVGGVVMFVGAVGAAAEPEEDVEVEAVAETMLISHARR